MDTRKDVSLYGIVKAQLQRLFSRRFTFMLIPHGSGSPRQINIHLSHIVLFLALWTGVTCWSSYLSAQHIDYWRTKLSNQVLTLKINYLIYQLDQSSGFLDEVKQLEAQLRDMLKYKDEVSLIQGISSTDKNGTGGPTVVEQNDITSLLKSSQRDISWNRITDKATFLKNEAKLRVASFDSLSAHIETRKRMFRATPRGWPCPGHLTSHFGKRIDPFSRTEEFHFGLDISGPQGTPIRATADGVVRIAGWHSGYGNLVVLQHDFGYSTRYAHNSRFVAKPGQRVKRGETIALMGATGKASGPHTHYEVWRYNKRQNPFSFLKGNFPAISVSDRAQKITVPPLQAS